MSGLNDRHRYQILLAIWLLHASHRNFMMRIPKLASLEPTFASLHTLDPCMIKRGVAVIPAVLKPSATMSATAVFAGFLDSTAFGAFRTDPCRRSYGA